MEIFYLLHIYFFFIKVLLLKVVFVLASGLLTVLSNFLVRKQVINR